MQCLDIPLDAEKTMVGRHLVAVIRFSKDLDRLVDSNFLVLVIYPCCSDLCRHLVSQVGIFGWLLGDFGEYFDHKNADN